MKKIKTGYILVATIALLLTLLYISNSFQENKNQELMNNGIETTAVISKIAVNNYKANELEGRFIENFVITFNFMVDEQSYQSVRTIEKKDYKKYFDRVIKAKDTIRILYDASNPKNNKIKALHLSVN